MSLWVIQATPVLELEHATIQPEETLIGKIYTSGTLHEGLSKSDIRFFEGRKEVYFDYELYAYKDVYYLFVIFNREGTFTITTPELLYTLGGEVRSQAIETTIVVAYDTTTNTTNEFGNASTNESDTINEKPAQLLSIKPGIVYTFSDTATITLFNRGSESLTINTGSDTITIPAFQATALTVYLEHPLSFVELTTYKTFAIPVIYLNAAPSNTTNTTASITPTHLLTSKHEIIDTAHENETKHYLITLANTADTNITNISVISNHSLAVIRPPATLFAHESKPLLIELFIADTARSEVIVLAYTKDNQAYNLSIPVTVVLNTTNTTQAILLTCSEYGGTLCTGTCDGASNFTRDGYCCYGTCAAFETTPSTTTEGGWSYGWLIGILIFIVLAIIGFVILSKYKKTTPQTPAVKIERSNKKYENRMKGVVTRD